MIIKYKNIISMKLIHYVLFVGLIVSFFSVEAQEKKVFSIIIDAGHGGEDPGTMGIKKYKRQEKDIALSVSLKFGKLIEEHMPEVNVVYTRKKDVFIKLKDRPKIASKNDANLFVSIHCNSNPNSRANGAETYVLGMHKNEANFEIAQKENSVIFLENDYSLDYQGFDPNSVESIISLTLDQEIYLERSLELASLVQKNIDTYTKLRSRGVKQAGFWVLAQTYMPSVLIEIGFLSNISDSGYLASERGQEKIANSLYKSFKEYKKRWDEQTILGKNLMEKPNTIPAKIPEKKISANNNKIQYAVQLLVSRKKLNKNSGYLKGIKDVSSYKEGDYYKYYSYKSYSYSKALQKQQEAKNKGFNGAFVIAFKNGKRIPLKSTLKK